MRPIKRKEIKPDAIPGKTSFLSDRRCLLSSGSLNGDTAQPAISCMGSHLGLDRRSISYACYSNLKLMLLLLIIIVLILALGGGFPMYTRYGYPGGIGFVGALVLILVLLYVFGYVN
jgi:hypothetical protein